ncbi:FeoA family protein [uncultured Fibrobacter sp.]|jgi:ferrous iron transport protein A|uniref:FeoA family protein n=1 Tax=uncultured Fibrobacter sp. TaxID=261512 RepID=UPI0025DEDF75|nr:FeoA family protein [uncultured Fibrobacter sp.]
MQQENFPNIISLDEMRENTGGNIEKIEGDSRFISRIVSIGLTPGSTFSLLKNDGRSPLLVFCRDTVIAVNRKESSQILAKVNA